MLGEAAVAMWWDVTPELRSEWEDWHTREHMPERLSIPGFLRGSRWVRDASYFVLYELESAATLTGPAYTERLNNPTPWSRKMMPHHRNMVRSLCGVRASFGRALGKVMGTLRVEQPLDRLPRYEGLAAACLLESRPMADVPQTTEQKIRGGDAEANWIVLLTGDEASEVGRVAGELAPHAVSAVYRLSHSLTGS